MAEVKSDGSPRVFSKKQWFPLSESADDSSITGVGSEPVNSSVVDIQKKPDSDWMKWFGEAYRKKFGPDALAEPTPPKK